MLQLKLKSIACNDGQLLKKTMWIILGCVLRLCLPCACSTWTVDLAHLMRHFGLEVTLATTMIGANPGYFHEGFYMEKMAEDQCRVTQLFKVSTLFMLLQSGTCDMHVSRQSPSSPHMQTDQLVYGLSVNKK